MLLYPVMWESACKKVLFSIWVFSPFCAIRAYFYIELPFFRYNFIRFLVIQSLVGRFLVLVPVV